MQVGRDLALAATRQTTLINALPRCLELFFLLLSFLLGRGLLLALLQLFTIGLLGRSGHWLLRRLLLYWLKRQGFDLADFKAEFDVCKVGIFLFDHEKQGLVADWVDVLLRVLGEIDAGHLLVVGHWGLLVHD